MGEAALTGVPVVCTDVGASFRVVSDPVTFERFSAVVAPNDAYSLAKAQIGILALLDEWSKFAEDEDGYCPKLSHVPTKEEVKQVTERMYKKTEQRRRLGMMGRTNVLNSFSSDRYLREHEQMLWIGKYQAPCYRVKTDALAARNAGQWNTDIAHWDREMIHLNGQTTAASSVRSLMDDFIMSSNSSTRNLISRGSEKIVY
jgi:hypothetical protein